MDLGDLLFTYLSFQIVEAERKKKKEEEEKTRKAAEDTAAANAAAAKLAKLEDKGINSQEKSCNYLESRGKWDICTP